MENDWIGQRVSISGTKQGIVRYFGKTHFADGILCGIALDDTTGKHDGLVQGVRYFSCGENRGVFVPLYKIAKIPPINVTDNEKLIDKNKLKNNNESRLPSRIRFRTNSEKTDTAQVDDNANKGFSMDYEATRRLRRQSDSGIGTRYGNRNADLNSVNNNLVHQGCKPLNSSYTITRDSDFLNKTVTLSSFKESSDVNSPLVEREQLDSTFTRPDNRPLNSTFKLNKSKMNEDVMEAKVVSTNANSNKRPQDSVEAKHDLSNESLGILNLSQMADFSLSDEDSGTVQNKNLTCIPEVDSMLELDVSSQLNRTSKVDANQNNFEHPQVDSEMASRFANNHESKPLDRKTSIDIQDFIEMDCNRHSTPKDLNSTDVFSRTQVLATCLEQQVHVDKSCTDAHNMLDVSRNMDDTIDLDHISPVVNSKGIQPLIVDHDITPKLTHKKINASVSCIAKRMPPLEDLLNDHIDSADISPAQTPDGKNLNSDEKSAEGMVFNSTFQVTDVPIISPSVKEPSGPVPNISVSSMEQNNNVADQDQLKTLKCVVQQSSATKETLGVSSTSMANLSQRKISTGPRSLQQDHSAVRSKATSSKQEMPTRSRMFPPSRATSSNAGANAVPKAASLPKKNVVSKIKSMLVNNKKQPPTVTSPKRTRPSFLKLGNDGKLRNPICHSTPKSPGEPSARGPKETLQIPVMQSLTDSTSPINMSPKASAPKAALPTVSTNRQLSNQQPRVLASLKLSDLNSRRNKEPSSAIASGLKRKASFSQVALEPSSPAKSTVSTSTMSRASSSSRIAMLAKIPTAVPKQTQAKTQPRKSELLPPGPTTFQRRTTGGSLRAPSRNVENRECKIVRRTSIPKFKP